MRLTNLPIEDAWTQARFAMEVLLRSQNPEDQRSSQSALFAIRESHIASRAEAKALVATGYRLMQESNYSPVIDPLFEFMTDWIEAGAFAPDPNLRASVSRIAVKMADRLNPPLSCRIRTIIDRLQQDVRMRVRREARGGLSELCKPPNDRDACPIHKTCSNHLNPESIAFLLPFLQETTNRELGFLCISRNARYVLKLMRMMIDFWKRHILLGLHIRHLHRLLCHTHLALKDGVLTS